MAFRSVHLKIALAIVAALFAIASAATTSARAGIKATNASFSTPQDATRFVLELSDEPSPRVFVVEGPPRLVIDLDDVSFDMAEEVSPAGLVQDWRYGALGPTTGRIVFDLDGPALVARQFYLPAMSGKPGRLVVDIKKVSADRFASAARSAVAGIDVPMAATPGTAKAVVVLDPGHGGIDPGATSPGGIVEKDLVLDFAMRLRERLETIPGVAVRLTRGDDRFLSLNRRIRIARAYGADLFISLHADAAPQDFVHGATVYTLSERPSDAEAAALAARENLSDVVSGVVEPDVQEDVSGILADLLRKETKTFSHSFADALVADMSERVRMNSNPHRYARFRVLMAHDIPSVLLELGYLTNENDAHDLSESAWQEQAADAVRIAVANFFDLPLDKTEARATPVR